MPRETAHANKWKRGLHQNCCCRAQWNSHCNKMSFFSVFVLGCRGHCKTAQQLVGTFFFSLLSAFGYMS